MVPYELIIYQNSKHLHIFFGLYCDISYLDSLDIRPKYDHLRSGGLSSSKQPFFNLLKSALQNFFYSLKAHCFFWLGIACYFLATWVQRLPRGWSCRILNPGPSDSQPDAIITRPMYLVGTKTNNKSFGFDLK